MTTVADALSHLFPAPTAPFAAEAYAGPCLVVEGPPAALDALARACADLGLWCDGDAAFDWKNVPTDRRKSPSPNRWVWEPEPGRPDPKYPVRYSKSKPGGPRRKLSEAPGRESVEDLAAHLKSLDAADFDPQTVADLAESLAKDFTRDEIRRLGRLLGDDFRVGAKDKRQLAEDVVGQAADAAGEDPEGGKRAREEQEPKEAVREADANAGREDAGADEGAPGQGTPDEAGSPRTREEWVAREFGRLKAEHPDDYDEVLLAQAEDNADREFEAPEEAGKFRVGQTVKWGDGYAQYRGRHTAPDGREVAVVLPLPLGSGAQATVPLEELSAPEPARIVPVGSVARRPRAPAETRPAAAAGPAPLPEPWQMTKGDYIKSRGATASPESDEFALYHLRKVAGGPPGLSVEGSKVVFRGDDGQPLGVTTLRTAGGQKVVDDTAVHPEHRRKGIATALYRKAAELGHDTGWVENVASAGAKHKMLVAAALAAGKPVPPEVLADYPEPAPPPAPELVANRPQVAPRHDPGPAALASLRRQAARDGLTLSDADAAALARGAAARATRDAEPVRDRHVQGAYEAWKAARKSDDVAGMKRQVLELQRRFYDLRSTAAAVNVPPDERRGALAESERIGLELRSLVQRINAAESAAPPPAVPPPVSQPSAPAVVPVPATPAPPPAFTKPAASTPAPLRNLTTTRAFGELDRIRNDTATDPAELLRQVDAIGAWAASQKKTTPSLLKVLREASSLADRLRGGSGKGGVRLNVAAP